MVSMEQGHDGIHFYKAKVNCPKGSSIDGSGKERQRHRAHKGKHHLQLVSKGKAPANTKAHKGKHLHNPPIRVPKGKGNYNWFPKGKGLHKGFIGWFPKAKAVI